MFDGYDNFGRSRQLKWEYYGAAPGTRDEFTYTRNYVGSPLTRDIPASVNPADDRDQAYTYDGMHRLTMSATGTLSAGSIVNPDHDEQWVLDDVGNWKEYLERTSVIPSFHQNRSHNRANEITDIVTDLPSETWITPVYDEAGNMTTGPAPEDGQEENRYYYDPWNRLVKAVRVDGQVETTLGEYEYDGQGRWIVRYADDESEVDTRHDYYYNEQWQVFEVQKDQITTPYEAYVWHDYYIDAPALVAWAGVLDHYFCHDANYNVTSVTNNNGSVVERYEYSAYGEPTFLEADWTVRPEQESDIGNSLLYTGRRLDSETGLYYYRNRYYHAQLGRFVTRDPIGYAGGTNLYQYVSSRPTSYLDPFGQIGIFFDGLDQYEWEPNERTIIQELADRYVGGDPYTYFSVAPGYTLKLHENSRKNLNLAYRRVCEAVCAGVRLRCDTMRRAPFSRTATVVDHDIVREEPVDIFGWSRGGILAVALAKRLKERGCSCGGKCFREYKTCGRFGKRKGRFVWDVHTKVKPVQVRFLGLIDPVARALPWKSAGLDGSTITSNVGNVWIGIATDATRFGGMFFPTAQPVVADPTTTTFTEEEYDVVHQHSGWPGTSTIQDDLEAAATEAGVTFRP
jgi:RHS repeat-associated protein